MKDGIFETVDFGKPKTVAQLIEERMHRNQPVELLKFDDEDDPLVDEALDAAATNIVVRWFEAVDKATEAAKEFSAENVEPHRRKLLREITDGSIVPSHESIAESFFWTRKNLRASVSKELGLELCETVKPALAAYIAALDDWCRAVIESEDHALERWKLPPGKPSHFVQCLAKNLSEAEGLLRKLDSFERECNYAKSGSTRDWPAPFADKLLKVFFPAPEISAVGDSAAN